MENIFACKKCNKILNIEQEISNNIERYGTIPYDIFLKYNQKILDDMKGEKYICEKCLYSK